VADEEEGGGVEGVVGVSGEVGKCGEGCKELEGRRQCSFPRSS
jgi:hypothetical protein